MSSVVNIAACLPEIAARRPDDVAISHPIGSTAGGGIEYRRVTYRQLNEESDAIARGLSARGIGRGVRAVLMVPPGPDFFALAFAMAKAGVVPVVIDPGIGRKHLKACIDEAEPFAFIGVPRALAARKLFGWGRKTLKAFVSIGGRWPGAIRSLAVPGAPVLAETQADETAAILFTSGSTGPPKGVVYTHGNFAAQIESLRSIAGLGADEIDLPTFAPFALFDPALGMSTVVPQMDFSRPARADPARLVAAIAQERVTNMFCSPAILARLARFGARLPSLRRVICAGAPVPVKVLRSFSSLLADGAQVLTPYGATEALPVSNVGSARLLAETRLGTCVGRPAPGVELAIVPIVDGPISQVLPMQAGEIGEIAVRGAAVTRSYWRRPTATALAKIAAADGTFWHRMGDAGFVDSSGDLWFCGRKSQRVVAGGATLFTDPCEAVFNAHPKVRRSALVGARVRGALIPVVCIESEDPGPSASELRALALEHPQTAMLETFLFHQSFPVDARHNAKIRREELAVWAARRLSKALS
jgi:olefin beta-lactone synthetase